MWWKRDNPYLSCVLIYKKYQRINICVLRRKKLEKKLSDKHRCTTITGKNQPNPENKSMPMPTNNKKKS